MRVTSSKLQSQYNINDIKGFKEYLLQIDCPISEHEDGWSISVSDEAILYEIIDQYKASPKDSKAANTKAIKFDYKTSTITNSEVIPPKSPAVFPYGGVLLSILALIFWCFVLGKSNASVWQETEAVITTVGSVLSFGLNAIRNEIRKK